VTAKPRVTRIAIAAVAFTCGITLASGVAAVATSATKTVKACETSRGYLVGASKNKCPKRTNKVTLDQRGPRGPVGKAGSNGLSTALVGTQSFDGTVQDPYQTISSIASAPAGSYVVSYHLIGYNQEGSGTGPSILECRIPIGSAYLANGAQSLDSAQDGSVAATVAIRLTAATTIAVQCDVLGGTTVTVSEEDLVATRVNTLTPNPAG
jgi:hypothetical protein